MTYRRFLVTMTISTIVMFMLMYSTALELDHATWSQTRLWMALYMGATMAVIMLVSMRSMFKDARANRAIFVGATAVFVIGLYLARSQVTVGDVAWMRAMIPHHSIAILTSERAHISDPRVRHLADGIISSQRREIAEMKMLIDSLDHR